MEIIIPIRPFPAVRVNSKWWRFTPKAQEYHTKSQELRLRINKNKKEIIDWLNSWLYHIQFHFAMAESWSEKKKKEIDWEYHTQKPDIDNLCKAFFDSVFYWEEDNDCKIWNLSASKHWSREDKIIIYLD